MYLSNNKNDEGNAFLNDEIKQVAADDKSTK